MDEHQLDATGLTEDIILEIKRKQALATKYVMNYIKNNDFRGYNEDPLTLLNWDGDYYKARILPDPVSSSRLIMMIRLLDIVVFLRKKEQQIHKIQRE